MNSGISSEADRGHKAPPPSGHSTMFFAKNKRSRRGDLANALSFVAMFGDLLLIFAGFL